MIPAVGQRIGPYEILGRLGSGGMGLVFSAWDERLQRDVAIKLLREEFLIYEMRERFLQEARAASGLNHPNICTIFDIGQQQGDPYLVMELLKGETLRSRISSGPVSPEEILHIAKEVAEALSVAHDRGIIHRDVKPANIFLVSLPGGRSQTKVLDFGLAKIDVGDTTAKGFELTGAGATVGTVSYMSPEQARGEQLDARSDLFSLGVVMYEMAAGQVPFRGTTSALVFVQLLSHPPELIRTINANVPKELEKIILKLLAKQRSARYQTAAELVQALSHVKIRRMPESKPVRSLWSILGMQKTAPKSPLEMREEIVEEEKPVTPEAPVKLVADVNSVIRPVRRTVNSDLLAPIQPRQSRFDQPSPPVWPTVTLPPTLPASAPASSQIVTETPNELPKAEIMLEPLPPQPAPVMTPALPLPVEQPPRVVKLTAPAPKRKLTPRPARMDDTTHERPIARKVENAGDAVGSAEAEPRSRTYLKWVWVPVALLLIGGAIVWKFSGNHTAAAPVPHVLMLAAIANHTADSGLDEIIGEALRLDMEQSTRIAVQNRAQVASAVYAAGLDGTVPTSMDDARKVATASGAQYFLFGEINNVESGYTVAVRVYESATGAKVMAVEETAVSRGEIAGALDRIAQSVRAALGESGDSIGRTSIPLSREATANLDALRFYIAGESALDEGKVIPGIKALQQAVAADPKFVQPMLRLAAVYRAIHAEVAASNISSTALDQVLGSSEKMLWLAKAAYDLNVTHDLPHAQQLLNQELSTYPADPGTLSQLAEVQRRQGKFAEAQSSAQSALALNPRDSAAATEAELSMLALDHADAADRLEVQMQRSGQPAAGLSSITALLVGRTIGDVPPPQPADPLVSDAYVAQSLDAQGELRGGLVVWLQLADESKTLPELVSAGTYALAQASLNRALVEDCSEALPLAKQAMTLPRGQDAIFAAGLASALCKDNKTAATATDELTKGFPQSFSVQWFYLAQLNAVTALRSSDAAGALQSLQAAHQAELLSLTPYLRGLAHSVGNQPQLAIADFQGVLLHRGAAMIIAGPSYAMAQIGLARAYAASGDVGNSARAYSRFSDLWTSADAGNPLVNEAQHHRQ